MSARVAGDDAAAVATSDASDSDNPLVAAAATNINASVASEESVEEDDVGYDALVASQEEKEREDLDEHIEKERETVIADWQMGEVLGNATYSKTRLAEMRSLYVTDPSGKEHHKKSLLKSINKGKSLTKSFDRLERVKGSARKGRGSSTSGDNVNSVVTRAFDFKYSHDTAAEPNSGTERYNSDDFCCVMVESKNDVTKAKSTHMVISKFQRFGCITTASPLELFWDKSKSEYRASVLVLAVVEYENIAKQLCVQSTGKIVASIRNVHSSCIIPITPTLEETVSEDTGMLVTNAVMKVEDLNLVFKELSSRKRHLRAKNAVEVEPVEVEGKNPFVVSAPAAQIKLPVCNICVPPKALGKHSDKPHDIQRAIRNHAAAHQLHQVYTDEPCGLCCKATCTLEVDITQANRRNILEQKGKIVAGAFVYHNCNTFIDIEPFHYKFCNKAVAGYPCTNKPVLCHACPTMHFIWSYNIESHFELCHDGLSEEEREKYTAHFPKDDEKAAVMTKFPINVNMVDND